MYFTNHCINQIKSFQNKRYNEVAVPLTTWSQVLLHQLITQILSANNNTEELNSNNYDCFLGLFLLLPPYKLHVIFQKCEKNKNKHCQTNQYG